MRMTNRVCTKTSYEEQTVRWKSQHGTLARRLDSMAADSAVIRALAEQALVGGWVRGAGYCRSLHRESEPFQRAYGSNSWRMRP